MRRAIIQKITIGFGAIYALVGVLGFIPGIKPSGKRFEFTGVNIDRVVNGRIVEHGGAANLLLPLLQSGSVRIAH